MRSEEISTMPTTFSTSRVHRRIRTRTVRFSKNLYRPRGGTDPWLLCYLDRFVDGLWMQGQMEIRQGIIRIYIDESYLVDLRKIPGGMSNALHA